MNAKLEKVIWRKTYQFYIESGSSEDEARAEADRKIGSVNRTREIVENEKLVDVTTGKTHKMRV